MKRLIVMTLFLLSNFFVGQQSAAENCWMTGCVGMIGYLFVPPTQAWTERNGTVGQLVLEDQLGIWASAQGIRDFRIKDSNWLFKEPGLPNVNAEVILNTLTALLGLVEVDNNVEILKAMPLEIDRTQKLAIPRSYELHGEFAIREGTIVKILGYLTKAGETALDHHLFALVAVVKDGR